MKQQYFILLLLINFIYSLPHFKYDGIKSSKECLMNEEIISFTIYGTLSEEINSNMIIEDYIINDIGAFKCSIMKNKNSFDKARRHQIECIINGTFERKGYIMEEPIVHGFDFLNKDNGETTWPEKPERKTFLIGDCGDKIELDDEPILKSSIPTEEEDIFLEIRENVVDNVLSFLPKRTDTTIKKMCEQMNTYKSKNELNNAESVWLVYKWISENIAYDCYGLNHGKVDYSMDGTYSAGKGVCNGYSLIFKYMCDSLGIEAVFISGYSKGGKYAAGEMPIKTDHAWNAVRINSKYYLIDVTWGSGLCDGDKYVKKLDKFYFCTQPEKFIRTHLPADSQWQLLDEIIDLQTFVNIVELGATFYDAGFTDVSPSSAIINTNKKLEVTLSYDPSVTDIAIITKLSYLEGNTYIEEENCVMTYKYDSKFELTAYLNKKGQYTLKIYAGNSQSTSYMMAMDYIIKTTQANDPVLHFPTLYGLFAQSDMKILSPEFSPLMQGSRVDFKIQTTTFDNLYVSIGDSGFFTELTKKAGGIFEEEDILIFGNKVGILTKVSGGKYNYICIYDTIENPNGEKIVYPTTYSGPKNKLIEPITDTLVKGKTYTFKIECDSVTEMVIIDGTWTKLTKSGNTFSGTVKINGSSGSVKIAYMNGNSAYSLYAYKVSS